MSQRQCPMHLSHIISKSVETVGNESYFTALHQTKNSLKIPKGEV